MSLVRYRGTNSRGEGRTGCVGESIRDLVQAKYRAGWRTLEVTRDGEEVGGIGVALGRTRIVWWTECDPESTATPQQEAPPASGGESDEGSE